LKKEIIFKSAMEATFFSPSSILEDSFLARIFSIRMMVGALERPLVLSLKAVSSEGATIRLDKDSILSFAKGTDANDMFSRTCRDKEGPVAFLFDSAEGLMKCDKSSLLAARGRY
jgi:hypothetical protein